MSAINKLKIKPSASCSQCFVLQQGKLRWLAPLRDTSCASKGNSSEMGQKRNVGQCGDPE